MKIFALTTSLEDTPLTSFSDSWALSSSEIGVSTSDSDSFINLAEFCGKLQNFELSYFNPPVKSKGLALKADTSKSEKSESENESELDLALFVKNFKKFAKFNKKVFESKDKKEGKFFQKT